MRCCNENFQRGGIIKKFERLLTASIALSVLLFSSCSDSKAITIDPIKHLIGDDAGSTLHIKRLYDKESPYTLCYENSDGTKSLYIFTSPIAFYNGDMLVPIDNSLVAVSDKETRKKGYRLENRNCDIKSYFPKNLLDTPFLIQSKDVTLSFSPSPELTDKDLTTNVFPDTLGRKLPSVTYQKDANIHLEYVPTSSGIMASITINSKPEKNTLDFFILRREGIRFTNKDNQYVLFQNVFTNMSESIIYTTFLQDAVGAISFDNKVNILPEGDQWKYTLVLDEAFLNAPDTQYPLTISPIFELYRNKMPDSTVYENKPLTNLYLANYAVFGDQKTFGDSLHYLRFRIHYVFQSYEQNIKSASYVTTALAYNSKKIPLQMQRLQDIWSSTGINWSTKFKTYGQESENTILKSGRYSFDITKFVKNCIMDDEWNTEVYGLAMSATDGEKGTTVVATSDNTVYQPYVRIDFYDLPWGFEKLYSINPDQGG